MENNEDTMETENFYYEDIVEGVNTLLTKETTEIFREAGISKQEIMDRIEKDLPPIFDNESLDEYCKRFLQFILIDQLNSNFAENIDQKAKMNKTESNENKPHVEPQLLKKYINAFNNGDYIGIYNVICSAYTIFTLIGNNRAKPHYFDKTQLKVYQKYINDYRKKLLGEFSKITIPQPVYEDSDTESDQLNVNDDFDFDVEDVIDDSDDSNIESENIVNEVEDNEVQNVQNAEDIEEINDNEADEESFLDNFNEEDNTLEDKNIDTESILASIDELDDVESSSSNETLIEEESIEEDELPGLEEESIEEDELPGLEEESIEEDELPGLEEESIEEDELPGLEEESIEEDELPGFEEESIEEDELPGLEEDSIEEDELPGLEEESIEEDELPGFEEDSVEEDELPGLEEDNMEEDELPGLEEDSVEEDELPGLEEESIEEDELPGFEEDNVEEDELPGLEEDSIEEDELPGFEEDSVEEDELPGLEEDSIEEDELPGLEEDSVEENSNKNLSVLEEELSDLEESLENVEETLDEEETSDIIQENNDLPIENEENELEEEEQPQIVDERRNYDLNFEDNYYEILDISIEYVQAHPNYKDAKFVEATGGTNLDDFISTMLYLRDSEKTEVVGIFNNIPLYTHNLYTVDDIEALYDKLVEEIDEDENNIKPKSECITYDEYYNQFIQKDVSAQASKYQQEHQDIKMILVPQNDATIQEFVESALYFIQEDMTGTILKYGEKSIFASDYSTQEEMIKALTEDEVTEKTDEIVEPQEEDKEQQVEETEKESFDKSPEYYKSIAKISKNKTDAYRQRHPECKKVMIVVERDSQTAENFFEAVRYYNSINKNIIAQYDGIQLIARKYNSAKEMIEAYKLKKFKKTK